jgi:predicted RNA methylase
MSNPADTYENEMVPVVFGPWVPFLLEAANPRPKERVLDLARGTGIVARTVRCYGAGFGRDMRATRYCRHSHRFETEDYFSTISVKFVRYPPARSDYSDFTGG